MAAAGLSVKGGLGRRALRLWTLRAWPGRLAGWLVLEQVWAWREALAWQGREGSGGTESQDLEGREDILERAATDPAYRPSPQNASQDLLGEALAQHIRQQIDARGDHPLSHYSLDGAWGHGMGTAHVSVLAADGSAVAATSTINTPCVSPEAGGQAPLLCPPDLSPLPPHPPPVSQPQALLTLLSHFFFSV